MKHSSLILCLMLSLFCTSCASSLNTTAVKNVSISQYMGLWYEIARIDHSFQRNLVGCTAYYSLLENGKVKVVNSGFKDNFEGKKKVADGIAKIPDPNEPGKLRVSFFLNIYSGYNIIALDTIHYQWAMVGGNKKDYLWILSRQTTMSPDLQLRLIENAKARGYETDKLIFPPQQQITSPKE